MNDNKKIRAMIIALLDDPHGINEAAFDAIEDAIETSVIADILSMVSVQDSRYFLPEDHGLTA